MEKSLNLQIHDFKEGLIRYCNSSNIPASAKQMVLNEVLSSVSQANMMLINQERIKLQKEHEENINKEEQDGSKHS